MKNNRKYVETVKSNCEYSYNDFIRGFLLGDIIRNYIVLMLFIIVLAFYLPNTLFCYTLFIILSFSGMFLFFFDITRRRTVIGLGKKGFVIGIFGFNTKKYVNLHEILFDNIRYIALEGLMIKKVKITFIDTDGKLKSYKIAINRMSKMLDSYYNVTNEIISMQKVFDRGDF